jgi:hypothetical protein
MDYFWEGVSKLDTFSFLDKTKHHNYNIYCMDRKEELSLELTNRLKELFVEDFDKVNGAKNDVNDYLESIDIHNKYDYNEFCSDFLKVSEKLIHSLTISDIQNADAGFIMGEIMTIMVKYKIMDSEPDDTQRLHKLLQHELKTRIARKNINDSS